MAVDFDFDQYPTLLEVAKSDATINVVIGPTGSAKTSGMLVLLLREAIRQAPGPDGVRRTKSVIARQTYAQMTKTTVPSAQTMLRGVVDVNDGKPPSGSARFPLEDGTQVQFDIVFLALDGPNVRGDILGLEYTNGFIDEISEVADEALILALLSRAGRYPSAKEGGCTRKVVYAATNGPRKSHWLYDWHMGVKDDEFAAVAKETGRPYFKLFQQPAGLIKDAAGVWHPNPAAENVKNLPGGYAYYFEQLLRPPQEVQSYVEGKFADLQFGKVVYSQFRTDMHVIDEAKVRPMIGSASRIMLAFDWGRTPVCLVIVPRATGGFVVVDEIVGEDISIDGLWKEAILPTLQSKYPRSIVTLAIGDPAGADRTQASETSPFEVLAAHGVEVRGPYGVRKDAIAPRVEAVRQRLQRLDSTGTPFLQITSNCKLLIDALLSGYIYEQVRGQAAYKETPTKSHAGWCSDLANALEYISLELQGDLAPPKLKMHKAAVRPLMGG